MNEFRSRDIEVIKYLTFLFEKRLKMHWVLKATMCTSLICQALNTLHFKEG